MIVVWQNISDTLQAHLLPNSTNFFFFELKTVGEALTVNSIKRKQYVQD
jgi:hypothetical protein